MVAGSGRSPPYVMEIEKKIRFHNPCSFHFGECVGFLRKLFYPRLTGCMLIKKTTRGHLSSGFDIQAHRNECLRLGVLRRLGWRMLEAYEEKSLFFPPFLHGLGFLEEQATVNVSC